MEQQFIFAHTFSTPFIFTVGIISLVFAFFSYIWTKRPISLDWKLGLLSLRLFAILLMILTLMRPGIEQKEKFVEKAQLFFLLDQSESMTFRDQLGESSRAEKVNREFAVVRYLLDQIQKKYDVKIYDIRNQLLLSEKGLQLNPDGFCSPITQSLRQFLSSVSRKRSLGAVLISDGQDTQAEDPSSLGALFAQKNLPVYVVGVGEPQMTTGLQDIRAQDLEVPLTSFQENTFVIDTAFHFLGCRDEEVELELLIDDQSIEKQTYHITNSSDRRIFKFFHSLPKKGLYKVTVQATALEQELSFTNNKIETFIEILEGDLKVLYLEGQSRSEFKFLSRAFDQAREIHLKSLLLFKGLQQNQDVPQQLEEWMKYDVLIIGDIPKNRFRTQQLEDIKKMVEQGGRGFLMIGGFQNYGSGDYQDSPLADVLPVQISPQDEQYSGLFLPKLTVEGEKHFALRLDQDSAKSLSAWEQLPELDGYNKISKVKPTASVLLMAKEDPLLVYYPYGYGKGRSMAFMADTTWRWCLTQKETELYFKKFWRQMILWLARRDNLSKEKVWIQLEQRRFPVLQKIPIRVMAEKTSGELISGNATLTLISPTGQTEKLTSSQNEEGFSFQYQPTEVGVYTIQAEVTHNGTLLGKDETKWIVFRPNLELENPRPDFETLELLAQQSQGQFYLLAQFKNLLEELDKKPSAIVVEKVVIKDLWDNWIFFLLFLIALGAEWVLRKYKGLA